MYKDLFRGFGKSLLIMTTKWENEFETSVEGWHGIYIDTTTKLWKENLLHLFWNCNFVQDVWFAVKKTLQWLVVLLFDWMQGR